MKKFTRRCAAIVLALALTAALGRPAFASWALGSELVERTVELGPGTALTTQSLWSLSKNDLRTEHYVTYSPNTIVTPMVFSGTYVASTNTVSTAAAQLEEQGYRVAAAINGGFFNTDGTIVGMLVTEGIVRSLDVDSYAMLGFTTDGRVFIDESKPTASLAWTGLDGVPRAFPMSGFNAYRHSSRLSGLYLYNKDFSSRVMSGGPNVSAILRPVGEDGLKMNGSLTFEVVSVTDTTQEGVEFNGVIPDGCYMIYGEDHDNAELLDALRGLLPGMQIVLTLSGASAQWEDAAYGISGLYTLLRDGQIVNGLPTADNPYTAVGLKADGTAVFYTIDGRQSGWSVGASYDQVAQRLQELDCVSAVALDGGGSTTLGATLPGSDGFAVLNRPSTAGRRINNTILLVSRVGEDIIASGAYVGAAYQVVLTGAQLPVSARAYDSTGRPVDSQYLSWTATGGFVTGAGGSAVYTAGTIPGTYAISASGENGSMPVRVVDQLSSLTVSQEGGPSKVASLVLEPGAQAELNAAGTWWNLPVAMSDGDVAWYADPAIGAIDSTGHFTAGMSNGEGTITATAGGKTVVISVKVERSDPFTDIIGHWSANYVIQLYKLGLTTGYEQPDGTAVYRPDGRLTRAELLTFIARLLGVNPAAYEQIALPFADADAIEGWAMPYVKAMYTLKVLQGSEKNGRLYADVNSYVTREETMTFLGRVLAVSQSCDLSAFPDAGSVSSWAAPYVQTLVALNIVEGSGGLLNPRDYIDRGAIAKLLVEVYPMEKALLLPRLDLMS